ncbi:hypothetical protein [Streptomyces sp. JNUCC 63]
MWDYVDRSLRTPRKAWLVRGLNVAGRDLVRRLWLPEGLVTLAAAHLPPVAEDDPTKSALRRYVQEGYDATASYSQKQAMVDELHYWVFIVERCGGARGLGGWSRSVSGVVDWSRS